MKMVAPRLLPQALLRKSDRRLQATRIVVVVLHETNIFPLPPKTGREFFLENTRCVWTSFTFYRAQRAISFFTGQFHEYASTDLRNRRSNWIAKSYIVSVRQLLLSEKRGVKCSRWYAFTHMLAIAIVSCNSSLILFGNENRPSADLARACERAYPRLSLHSTYVVLHYGTDAIWNSISLCVFPMNNIGSVSRPRRLHDRDSNNRTGTPRYRKLLIPPQGRRYKIDL